MDFLSLDDEIKKVREEKLRKEKEIHDMNNPVAESSINPMHMDEESFHDYCKLYLSEKIYNKIAEEYLVSDYSIIYNTISDIPDRMYDNLIDETGRIILVNKIHSLLFQMNINALSLDFLYELVCTISKYDRRQYLSEVM